MMNQNTNNNGNRNTALETALEGIIKNCTNIVKFADMEKLAIGTSCEGDYICCTVDITEKLQKAKEEVERLESVISECEAAKAKTEAQEKAKKEAEEMFLGTLNASGKETLSYLEGLETLAKGEQLTLVKNIESVFRKYSKSCELAMTANLAAYVAILIKEEQREVINLLESITLKIHKIQCAANIPDERVIGTFNVLFAIQDLY